MWTFVFLFILGANICQAAAKDNSTQMYYAKIIIDESALGFIRSPDTFNFTDFEIKDFKNTTECRNTSSSHKECECFTGHTWSEEAIKSLSCSNGTCISKNDSDLTCVSDSSVSITGSITLTGNGTYTGCLKNKDSQEYKICHGGLLEVMKKHFSALKGFDTVSITKFRVGSIIAEFKITFATSINVEDLTIRSQNLTKILEAMLNLETTGIVVIKVPEKSVKYSYAANISCTTKSDLGSMPEWYLRGVDGVVKITNGSVALLTSGGQYQVFLNNVTEHWEGEYRCVFTQNSGNTTIRHIAKDTMDVCLLPDIYAYAEPAFPVCKTKNDVQIVKVYYQIKNSSENYTVKWKEDVTGDTLPTPSAGGTNKIYTAEKIVHCGGSTNFSVTCSFTNKCDQMRDATVVINMIGVGEDHCEADGDWGNTKRGYTAELLCKGQAGLRQRKCKTAISEGKWEKEQSSCVSFKLQNVLEMSEISDTGLGELEKNAAQVFELFESVTATENLNSIASIDKSTEVLNIMKDKLTTMQNTTTINDMLDSSSHLLNESLKASWVVPTTDNSTSFAGRYLVAVEKLIEKANITETRARSNLEVDTCANETCTTSVFNVEVTVSNSGNGTVKTTGFQHLVGYFPNNSNESEPNSIIVSTTKENKTDSLQIVINFDLFKPRPPNVEIQCVSWDNNSNQWTSRGCKWGGSANEGQCICNHLSSFSILLSKHPLEVPGLTHVTYVGLSVSVISLVACLIVELFVWKEVVKTNTLYLRHTAHVNISLCLLIANCCFLASPEPPETPEIWCKTFALVKHFCYLSMFFWMFCLSSTLLHQAVFLFHKVSKTSYLRFSIVVGYVFPLLIVSITFIATEAAGAGMYYAKHTCWLVYSGMMKGTIFTFIIPMGIIVFFNAFAMFVVIMKLLDHHQNSEKSSDTEKSAAKTVLRSVIFLTPIFGVTWIFGLAVLAIDLTDGVVALAVNYIFNLLNAFQGFFILLTTCVADQRTREALLKRFRTKAPASISESTTKLETTWKK